MVTPYEVFCMKMYEADEMEMLSNGEPPPDHPVMTAEFFEIEEIRKWTGNTWARLVEEEGVVNASKYILRVWKNVNNAGEISVKFLGKLSSFVHFGDNTISYLFYENMGYDWAEEENSGNSSENPGPNGQ